MKRTVLIAIVLGIAISVVGIRFIPLTAETYRDIAHYAVSVRKASWCDEERSFFDEKKADAAFAFIAWNRAGYQSYRASGRQLLNFTVGKTKCSNTAIRFRVESDRAIRGIELGLERGEDLHALNALGESALHMAVYAGNHEVVEFLLDRGASLDQENAEGKTASQILASLLDGDIGYDATHIEPLLRIQY